MPDANLVESISRGDIPVAGSVGPSLEGVCMSLFVWPYQLCKYFAFKSLILAFLVQTGNPFTANGKQAHENVCKDTKDLLTLKQGMEVDRDSQNAQHQTSKDQLLKQIKFSYFIRERGGFEQLEKLLALSNHYDKLYVKKVSKLSSEQQFSQVKELDEGV